MSDGTVEYLENRAQCEPTIFLFQRNIWDLTEFLTYRYCGYRRGETLGEDPVLVVFLWAGYWEYKLVYLRYIIPATHGRYYDQIHNSAQ
jgi:hypothetical protein